MEYTVQIGNLIFCRVRPFTLLSNASCDARICIVGPSENLIGLSFNMATIRRNFVNTIKKDQYLEGLDTNTSCMLTYFLMYKIRYPKIRDIQLINACVSFS